MVLRIDKIIEAICEQQRGMYVVFGREGCRWCAEARALLDRRVGHHKYHDVDSALFRDEYARFVPAGRWHGSVPIVFYGHHFVGGYDDLVRDHFA